MIATSHDSSVAPGLVFGRALSVVPDLSCDHPLAQTPGRGPPIGLRLPIGGLNR
jgi:hypothetical protein